jgi:ABC-2 type transport system permease protein
VNIFLRELKANLRSLLVWGGIVVVWVFLGFTEFGAYAGNPEMLAILDSLPPALMSAFSMEAFNLTTVSGFWGVMFIYCALLLSLAAVLWGGDIISKEERDKTVEFSLALPVTRGKLVTAKTLAAAVNCFALLVITLGVSLANAARYKPDRAFYDFLFLSMVALFILQMIFLAVGIFLGCAMKHYKRASSVAISLWLGTFFLSVLSGLSENLEFLKYFTPFKYFDPARLLHESRIDLAYVGLSAGIIAVCLVGAYLAYSRRDLYI